MSSYRLYDRNTGGALGPVILGILTPVALTGVGVTSGSAVITVASTTGLFPFMGLNIGNLPPGAFIQAVKSATEIIAFVPTLNVAKSTWTVIPALATATASGMQGLATGFNPTPIPEALADGIYRNTFKGGSSGIALLAPASGARESTFVSQPIINGGAIPADGATFDTASTSVTNAAAVVISGLKAVASDEYAGVPPRTRVKWVSFYHLVGEAGGLTKMPAGPEIQVVKID